MVGTGFLFGYNLDQVKAEEQKTEATTTVIPKAGDTPQSANKVEDATEPKQEKAPEVGTETPKSGTKEETVPATSPQVAETNETSSTKEIPAIKETPATKEVPENKANKVDKEIVNSSTLREKLADLEAQIERIRGNKKQASHIQNAEKLVADAKQYLEALDTTQAEVDAKAKEISSLTKILKSIKAKETPKINKNQDRRNGKMLRNGTGFRIGNEAPGGATTTGVGADVVDAKEDATVTRPPYTKKEVADGLAKQIAWLDFSDERSWTNVDKENGNIYLKEGSVYEKEIMPNYHIKLTLKSLKPFQATEIYRKRMEAHGATPEEKATFNPNATNGRINSTDSTRVKITAQAQDMWSEIKDNGINTNGRKTSIQAEGTGNNIGIQFEISGTYKGNLVRPAVVMADAEGANVGEMLTFTTNGSGWKQIIDLKKNRSDARRYKPVDYYTPAYHDLPDSQGGNDIVDNKIYDVGNGNKIAPKFFTNPDQETGGLGSGVFGPGLTSRSYSVPVVMTKGATEVGMYVFSSGAQAVMMGVAPIDEGDAPESYGEASHTMNTRDGLSGATVKQPFLGSERPDADNKVTKDWHGDDNTDTADEGIKQLLPDSLKESEGNIIKANISNAGYYTLNIQAHTGGAEKAYIRSWIDFNNNGQFDSDEASDIAEITQDGDVKLHFKNKTQKDAGELLQAGTRVRIATSKDEIMNPTGLAFSGEVEDFNAKITHPPKGDRQSSEGKATIGNVVDKQSRTVHFTPKGKNIYTQDDVDAKIDTTVPPVYIDNKTRKIITLSDENTYTVKGEGTYKFTPNATNPKDIDVEFTPAKGFVGEAHGITIRRQDTNKTTTEWGTNDEAVTPNVNEVLNTMDGLYIPKVTMPTVTPHPNNAESSEIQGFSQKGKPTFTVETSDTPVTASVKHPARLIDPRTNIVTNSSIVDALDQNNNKIGTYEIVPETGEVIFTPNVDYKGEVKPARVSVPVVIAHDKDDNDITVNTEATYSPTIQPVIPTAEAGKTEDVQGKPQVSRIVLNIREENADKAKTVNFNRSSQVSNTGEHVELNNESLTLVDASGVETNKVTTDQGEYVLDKVSKTITFTPKKTFVGSATPVRVQIKDANGTKVETTYTPTVLEVTPTGKDSATSGPQGLTQKSLILFNEREETDGTTLNFDTGHKRVALKPETLTLLNGTAKVKSITVENVGTYELVDNAITFTPAPAYHGTAEGVNVQVEDENGKIVTKKYVPTVKELTITPQPATTTNIQGETQEGTPDFPVPAESKNNVTVIGRKLVDPTDNTEKDSVKVEGKGTFTIDGNGKVTFVPLPTYKGDVDPITVKATVTITNGKNESTTITSTASYKPIIVPAEIDKAPATSKKLQGLVQTGTPTFTPKTIEVDGVQKTITVQPNSYKLVNGGIESDTLPAYKAGTTVEIGTYTIDSATGQVTFTPTDKTYTGAVQPVDVQATGSNGVKVHTTYTPIITPVTPKAEASATSDVQGKKQVSRIVLDTVETGADKDQTVNFNKGTEQGANGERVELDANTLTLLDGTTEVTSLTTSDGKYELDKAKKTITFTPNKTFTGPAKPVKVQIKDVNGTKVQTTYTPTVTDVTMKSEDKTSEEPQGKTQTGTPTFTVSTPKVPIIEYKLVDPTNNTPVEEVEVKNQGTYSIDKTTGEVTFVPKPGFTGPTTGITVRATDENGETKDATYTPRVAPLKVTPENKKTTKIQGLPQEATPTFKLPKGANAVVTERKLIDPITKALTNSVTVDGQGTFTINTNGKVTFTPVPSYVGNVDPITVNATVTITNDKNESATITSTATYKPIIVPIELEKEPAKSTKVQGLVQKGTPRFTSPESIEINGVETTVTVKPDSYKLVKKDGTETDSIPAYKKDTQKVIGEYTIDSQTGEVTFTPTDKTYTGEVEPATVQATGSNNVKVQTTYTPIIKPVKPVGTNAGSEGIQGAEQEGTPTFESGNENIPMTVSATNPAKFVVDGQPVADTTIPAKDNQGQQVGTYTIDPATGKVTFTPNPGFSGTPVPATVQAKDGNGTPTTATYTPVVKAAVPSGDNQVRSDIQGANQTVTPVFTPGKNTVNNKEVEVPFESTSKAKLVDPSKTGEAAEVTTLEVPKQGTYTIDDNGVVTFTPLPTFTGEATPVSIVRKDKNGTPATATFKPSVVGVTPSATEATTTKVQGATQETPVTFTPGKATIGTTEKSVPMDPTAYKLLGGQDGKTPLDTVPAMSKDGTKEVGTYTIKVVEGKPFVTFTPTDKTYAGKLKPVTVQGKDTNGTEATTTYTPVITPIVPTSENGKSEGPQGVEQTGSVTFNPGKEPGTENTPVAIDKTKMTLLGGTDGTTPVESLTVSKDGKEIGTYTLVKDSSGVPTGKVKFTPTDKSFVGEVPAATVQVKDANGTPVTATYTPKLTEVNPTSKPSETTGFQGLPQTSRVVLDEKDEADNTTVNFDKGNDKVALVPSTLTLVNADGAKVTSVTVPNEGTYELNNGVITFTPLPTFHGKASGVSVQAEDVNGKVAKTTYTPTVTEVRPVGTNAGSEGIQGAPQSGTPSFESGNKNIPMTVSATNPAKLVDPANNQPIEATEIDAKNAAGEKVGKYTINPETGEVTFTPTPGFSGTPVPAIVQAKDGNGTPTTATYTPVVKAAVPSGDNQVRSDIQGANQTVTPVFTPGKNTVNNKEVEVPFESTSKAKLVDPSKTGEAAEVTTLEVPKQGTYTIDDNGVVTFTPLPTFTGEATPVSIVRKDKNGTPATATFKPSVVGVTPSATEATTTKVQGATQETPVTFTPGKATIGTTEKSVPMDPTAYKLLGGQDGKTPLDTVPAMSKDGTKEVGTYTIKVVEGKPFVTFTPTDKTYAGKLKPVTVQGKDTNGTEATTTYTPVITPIVPTSENGKSEGPQGVEQTGSVTFNPGKEPGTENTPVAIDKTKMTLLGGTDGTTPVESLTVSKDGKEIGTYTLVKDSSGVPTGKVKFTPTDKSFVGEVPAATVQVKDANGTPVTATYTPILTKVTPKGESSETQGAKGKSQTSAVVFDKKDEDKSTVNFNKGDEKVALNPSTLTLVDKNGNPSTKVKVPGEGTYTLANNVITFTPELNFVGKTTGVTVQVKDINGTSIEKTYTPSVRAVTTFVDSTGKPITVDKNNKPVESEVDGSNQPTKDIYGYKFVRTDTDNNGNTKHIYEQAEGKSVKVTYVSTTGEPLSDAQTVKTKDKFIGTDYDASIEAFKLERIEKDGKVYLLQERKADSAAEKGKVSDKEQTVTYVYKEVTEPPSNQKYGSVVVVYRDKFGRPISGTTESGKEVASTEIDTPSSPLNTEYDTTDHKPQTITTKDGKKYKLIKVLKTSDAEKSGVKARTSVITYVYEMLDNTAEYPEAHIGLVLVNYLDEEGNPISGKTPEGKVVPNMVVDTEADLVGKDYDTTDHKVSTIIVENGDVYELLKVSESSVEKGKLTEGATNVNYIYHKVVTKFVDENGKEIKSPEKGRTDKKDIPEYTFKETKKDVNGNTVHVYTKKSSSTPVTPTPTPSTPSTEKETLYVDANGKPLQPAKKGQHPQDKIPGYEFVRTETDANGNVRHLYRKIQSTIPVEPVQPTAPTMPEQPAQPEVPTSPAQPVQPTEVKEVEAKRELPNTGTEDHASLAALGLLGALSGFGLLASKKKED